ncbi:calcium-binding protein [Planktotalea arctica]|uniref:calcium-binding protein n=1 Tax=Planktotalea arctica TaxID=1481893 RepID=UPI0032193E46
MIALILIPLALAFAFSGIFEAEIERIAEENGIEDFDPEAPSIYDGREVEFGTNTPDMLTGTNGDDVIFGLGQTDLIRGLSGDDIIEAGSNADTVFGGAGDDIIGGGTGVDVLYGDAGDDALLGNGGDDVLIGRSGNDLLIGGGGADSLNGGPGDDVLISGNIEIEDEGPLDVSASALAAVRLFSQDELSEADFDALETNGALNGVNVEFLAQSPTPTQGGELRGGNGNDLLVLSGGDMAEGGAGEDMFVLNEDMVNESTVQIVDYTPSEDIIAIEYAGENAPVPEIRDRGADALIVIGEAVIARVASGAGLSVDDLCLVRTGEYETF